MFRSESPSLSCRLPWLKHYEHRFRHLSTIAMDATTTVQKCTLCSKEPLAGLKPFVSKLQINLEKYNFLHDYQSKVFREVIEAIEVIEVSYILKNSKFLQHCLSSPFKGQKQHMRRQTRKIQREAVMN